MNEQEYSRDGMQPQSALNDLGIQTTTEICPAEYDAPVIEAWLEDNAREGWHLPEMDTDPVTQAEGYRYLARRMRRDLAVYCVLFPLALAAFWMWRLGEQDWLLDILQVNAPGVTLLRLVGLPLMTGLSVWSIVGVLKNIRALKAGVPLPRPTRYRTGQVLWGVSYVLLVYVVFAGPFLGDPKGILGREEAMAQARYVDVAVLEEGVTETDFFRMSTKKLELAPRMYETYQTSVWPDETKAPGAHTRYYRLLTVSLAEELERELVAEQERVQPSTGMAEPHLAAVETAELDSFYWQDMGAGAQVAVARLGRSVLAVSYYRGTADLRQHAAYLAQVLEEEGRT